MAMTSQQFKVLKTEVMRLRGIIIDIDQHRNPYKGKGFVLVSASSMIVLVQEARDIRLQGKPYDSQLDEETHDLLTGRE